jgi:hypothetical protein
MVRVLADDFPGAVCALLAQFTQLQPWILLTVVENRA